MSEERKDVIVSLPTLSLKGKTESLEKTSKFEAEIREINGKKILIIKSNVEEITYPDGRKDVIVHAPSLSLINKFMEENKDKLMVKKEDKNDRKT